MIYNKRIMLLRFNQRITMTTVKTVNPMTENLEALWVEHGYGTRFQGFQNLMRIRIRDVLLVSSLYDLYLFEEDGRLYELIRNEYQALSLSHAPELTRASSGHEAIRLAQKENRFDMILTTLHIEDMDARELVREARAAGLTIPIVLLSFDNRELQTMLMSEDAALFDGIFIWQGNFRIIIAIIKYLEDRLNIENDTRMAGVQVVLLIEDNVRFYSSYLPMIFTEILKQSQRLIQEGINLSHKFLRMRARPKIILCRTYEEAMEYFEKYQDYVLGVITDVDFPKGGKEVRGAGIELGRYIKSKNPEVSILMQSTNPSWETEAKALNASFTLKDSPMLLKELSRFMTEYFSFGDFIFRMPDGHEVSRATNLKALEDQLKTAPDECIRYHAERNHFSNWFKARTEFWLAHKLKPRKYTDYDTIGELRDELIRSIFEYRMMRLKGVITDFHKESFDPNHSIAQIGGGSLGGKARGLGFVNTIINDYNVNKRFNNIEIFVPALVVLGTDVFDQFMDENNLRSFAMSCQDDIEITQRFIEAEKFPEDIMAELVAFLNLMRTPLAIRSSSLLEDSQYHPFAGVYETYMVPNSHHNPLIRLNDLLNSIKKVYASTFYQAAKNYIKMTNYRLEEEKMAVLIQKIVGKQHDYRFYPDFAGVAKSYNFYPMAPQKPTDGIVSVALGLGKTVVDGGNTARFCPKYPTDMMQFTIKDVLDNSQTAFFALNLQKHFDESFDTHDLKVQSFELSVAEQDGSLTFTASTYSPENQVIYDGISRPGIRVINFGPILKHKIFPLPQILELLLDMGQWGMGTPVEIEFAANLSVPHGQPKEFGILQMRPLVLSRETEHWTFEDFDPSRIICSSERVMGNGTLTGIVDVVVVDYDQFDRARSRDVAKEVSLFNAQLIEEKRPYLLVGVGRWGSLDPWLGIPVNWDQIAGAKAIIETGFKEMAVTPSQGSHFFQNLTSFMIGYFTVDMHSHQGFMDWEWLLAQPAIEQKEFTKLVRFEKPLTIKMDGHHNKGIILKPEV
jgi:CheY-like chemotaxis protein